MLLRYIANNRGLKMGCGKKSPLLLSALLTLSSCSANHAVLPSVAQADSGPTLSSQGFSHVGFDFLGIKSRNWNCDAMLASLSTLPGPVPCGAFLDDTFGTSDTCLRRLLASGHCSLFRGHLAWTNHANLPVSSLIPGAKFFDALSAEYRNIGFYASAICEHSMTAGTSSAINAALRPLMPHVAGIVDSGMRAADPSAIRECHGPQARCTAVSLDGQNAVDEDVEAFKTHGQLYSLLWSDFFNCKFGSKDKRPPQQRTDCPNLDQFRLLVRIAYPQPPLPPGATLTGGEIYKPQSENYGGCQGRSCKPVLILKTNQHSVNVYAMGGQVLAVAPAGGKFMRPGLWRYYVPMTAFELGQKAEAIAGSEFCQADDGNHRVVFNCYRRGGVYH